MLRQLGDDQREEGKQRKQYVPLHEIEHFLVLHGRFLLQLRSDVCQDLDGIGEGPVHYGLGEAGLLAHGAQPPLPPEGALLAKGVPVLADNHRQF